MATKKQVPSTDSNLEKQLAENEPKTSETVKVKQKKTEVDDLYPTQVTLELGDLLLKKADLENLSNYVGNKLTVNQGSPIVNFFQEVGKNQHQLLLLSKKPG